MKDYEVLKFTVNSVLCREGDQDSDLYFVKEGKILICSRAGKMVTPLAYINAGEYFGELSFFDKLPRSADVVVIEEAKIVKIPTSIIKTQFPNWLILMSRQMTKKIRIMDNVIRDKGIKRKNVNTIKPLSIDEQRELYTILTS